MSVVSFPLAGPARANLVAVTTVYHDEFFVDRRQFADPQRTHLRVYHEDGTRARYRDLIRFPTRDDEPIILHRANILTPAGPGTAETLADFLRDPAHHTDAGLKALQGRMIISLKLGREVYATLERAEYLPSEDLATVTVRCACPGLPERTVAFTDPPCSIGLGPEVLTRLAPAALEEA